MNLKALRALHRHGGEASPHRTRTCLLAVGVVAVLTTALTGSLPALAVHTLDFCLQGDVTNPNSGGTPISSSCATAGQRDWTNFFDGSGTGGTGGNTASLPTGNAGTFTDRVFTADFPLPDKTTYATGSKDTLPISGNGSSNWQCATSTNVGAKVDLLNTYATTYRQASNGDTILYYGSEIRSANGNHNQGIWLLQDTNVGCSSATGTTNFTGDHVNGDLLFAVQLTGGGSKPSSASVVAFTWTCGTAAPAVCSPKGSGSLVPVNSGAQIGGLCGTNPDTACAISNASWSVTTPWVDSTSGGHVLGPQQFFEGGIDVTAVEALVGASTPCFSKFLTDTRSSQSPTATLFDFTNGQLQTCATPTVNTQLKLQSGSSQSTTPPDSNVTSAGVTVGSNVYDTSTLSGSVIGTPGGTVTYKLFANNNCTGPVPSTSINGAILGSDTGGVADIVSGPSAVTSNSTTLNFTSTGTYYWVAYYSGDGTNLAGNSGCAAEPLLINPASPSLSTSGASSGTVGTVVSVSDTATITNAFNPTGNVVFALELGTTTNNATTCGSAVTLYSDSGGTTSIGTSKSVAITSSATGGTASTGTLYFKPTTAGTTYYWVAYWVGDSNNTAPNPGGSAASPAGCGDPNEAVTVGQATPTLSTTMALTDTVTVSGDSPGGLVTFTLYPTWDCAGSPVNNVNNPQEVLLSGGTATTPYAIPISADGLTYSWKVHYNGDTNNSAVTDGCTLASHEEVLTSYAGQ